MLRYREGEPLVELVQHLAAAASTGDETAGTGAATPGEPEGANGATAGAAVASDSLPLPPRVEVRVPADAASNQNRQVRARQLWGKIRERERVDFFLDFEFFFLPFGRREVEVDDEKKNEEEEEKLTLFFPTQKLKKNEIFKNNRDRRLHPRLRRRRRPHAPGLLFARPGFPAAAAGRGQGRAAGPAPEEEVRGVITQLRALPRMGVGARR